MEYEIEDDGALYDYSTNPSLLPRTDTPAPIRPLDKRRWQKAEWIPEEETQLA